jgi:Tol biopolymer transport system component
VVFVSGRSGHGEVWIAASDGLSPKKITTSERTEVGSPSWSPDGRLIGFNGMPGDNFDVYVVESGGGVPRRLTNDPSNDGGPEWSRDSRWIYFMSDRTGRPEIWKIPSTGGQILQVTQYGGHQASVSPDGKWLYYSKSVKRPGLPEALSAEGEPGIFRIPTAGGNEERVLEEGVYGRWALSRSGIYVLSSGGPQREPSITFFRYDTWERKTLMTFPKNTRFGIANSLTVSVDDRWIVYAKYDYSASDLMLVHDY